MNAEKIAIAKTCLAGSENGTMTFPQIVGTLMQAGFESYAVDFRRLSATYYLTEGDSVVLDMEIASAPVAAAFDDDAIKAAIKDAQKVVPGYTYRDFCKRVMNAGCAGYQVSFTGRRAVYYGRTAETHVEHFPK
ncbi:DUF1398 domain-containing protein [Aestuariivirga litoralis]|uniref:DUF1398 domain-containing protein n=1 Tax=Aestuariivirga litoralis TaxID=2650924 RepID=UPI0018C62A1B|nr:DUF1398 family protein [Aestuariivirga litoralis]MBG1232461.1 DUF1398 domain-containing protein [Aestuariivirga litoralis]